MTLRKLSSVRCLIPVERIRTINYKRNHAFQKTRNLAMKTPATYWRLLLTPPVILILTLSPHLPIYRLFPVTTAVDPGMGFERENQNGGRSHVTAELI
ncbi:hypothetical protein CDAR_81021 [Caerostris darwini]|uniref:Uncharacterized protein n=1 Tax=Caerostris darwini TaxID=1538125 RepID=A0AAV4SDG3_9ARAC|nr:hypothetical protein CDAR_269141 [Caerostris darwini]GIY31231.1 hypothetical protein CDAR_81021 [Caerostris darwini]